MLCTEESGRTGQMDRQSACLACVTLELALRSAFEQLASHLSDFGRGGWRGSQYSVNIKKSIALICACRIAVLIYFLITMASHLSDFQLQLQRYLLFFQLCEQLTMASPEPEDHCFRGFKNT
jgi:hypothetical protein